MDGVVILVHGTGASAPDNRGTAWWQDQGTLASAIESIGLRTEAFIWSGLNDERVRRQAGRDLADMIREKFAQRCPVHLVGHSHGGSVIWHSLNILSKSELEINKSFLRGWVSVGTPFLHYGLRLPVLALWLTMLVASAWIVFSGLFALRWVELPQISSWRPAPAVAWVLLVCAATFILIKAMWMVAPYAQNLVRKQATAPSEVPYLGLWSTQDEPIHGLQTSNSFQVQFLGGGGLPLAPLGFLRRSWSTALNQLVNNSVARALQGSSIAHLELKGVKPWPCTELMTAPLPAAVDKDLIETANEHAATLGRRVRGLLAASASPVSGLVNLQRSASDVVNFQELVHTTYFQSQYCVQQILAHITAASRGCLGSVEDLHPIDRTLPDIDVLPKSSPSNRLGAAAFLGCIAVIAIFASAFTLQASLFEVSMLPLTAQHRIERLINAKQLSLALSIQKPAEQLQTTRVMTEELLRQESVAEQEHRNRANAVVQEYVRQIARAGETRRLLEAVKALSQPMHREFLTVAWPAVLENTSAADLIDVIRFPGVLPGPEDTDTRVPEEAQKNSFPGLLITVFKLGALDKIRPDLLDAIFSLCGSSALCRQEVHWAAVQAIMSKGHSPPASLLPVPAVFLDVKGKSESGNAQGRVSLMRMAGQHPGVGAIVRWALVTNQLKLALQVAVQGGRGDEPGYRWYELSPEIMRGLEHRDTRKAALELIEYLPWEDTLPKSALRQVGEAVVQESVEGPDRAFFVTAPWERFLALEDLKERCRASDTNAVDIDNRCQNRTYIDYEGIYRVAVREASKSPTLEQLALLSRKPGVLARAARDTSVWQSAVVAASVKSLCPMQRDQRLPSKDAQDLLQLLRASGPAPQSLPKELGFLVEATGCGDPGKVTDPLAHAGSPLLLMFADWLLPMDREAAKKMVRGYAWAKGYRSTLSGPVEVTSGDLGQWLLQNNDASGAIASTVKSARRYPLLRSAAYYRWAACMIDTNRPTYADFFAAKGKQAGSLERSFGRSAELTSVAKAESIYRSRDFQWQRLDAVCERCDDLGRVEVAAAIIPYVAARTQRRDPPQMECEKFDDDLIQQASKWVAKMEIDAK